MLDGATKSGKDALLGDRLELLLDQLMRAGLPLGPRDRINASALVADLVARGAISDFGALRPWLAPVLARSPADRERFFQVFDTFDPQPNIASSPLQHITVERVAPNRLWLVLALLALLSAAALAWIFWPPSEKPRPVPAPSTTAAPTIPPPVIASATPPSSTAFEILNRVSQAAERFEGAPTLEELGRALAKDSTIGWKASSYTIRLSELSGLPRTVPLALYGDGGKDGRVWAMVALALERIERPGREPAFAELLAAANETLAKPGTSRTVYELASKLPGFIPTPTPADKRVLIQAIQAAEFRARAGGDATSAPGDLMDEFTIQRSLAIAPDPKVRRWFADAPWMPRLAPTAAPEWAAYVALALPLLMALFWLANSLAIRKAYLRRRPPELPPLHLDLVSEAATRVLYPSSLFQKIAQKLRLRTSIPTQRLDIDASIAATIAGGGEMPMPVYEVARHSPEYLVLIERKTVADQDARRLRDLVGRLEGMVPLTIYYYRTEPSRLEPETAGRSVAIEHLQATYAQHRLLVLGSGAEFLDPATLKPHTAVEKLAHWSQRALLTPLALAEWGQEEFALAHELKMPIGRATPDGLLALAELLGLEGAESDGLLDMRGDGRARALPEVLRVRPQRLLYATPPADLPVIQIIQNLRNFLDGPGFEWLCALSVYPAIQWDLTLYLGVSLPARSGGDLSKTPLYSEERIAALTQLPWLRDGMMPNWLRAALIAELAPGRATEIRAVLKRLIDAAELTGDTRRDDAVKLRIAREPAKDRLPPQELMEDEVLLDFMARGRIEDFALPNASWLERFLPRGWLDRFGIPELAAGLVALSYAAAAYVLTPKPSSGALVTGASLPLGALALGGLIALIVLKPRDAYVALRNTSIRLGPGALAFSILEPCIWLLGTLFIILATSTETIRNWNITTGQTGPAALVSGMILALIFGAWVGTRLLHQRRTKSTLFPKLLYWCGMGLALLLLSSAVSEIALVATGSKWEALAWTSGIGLGLFLIAVFAVRYLPEQLPPPKPLPRGTPVSIIGGTLRAAFALIPILPAAWLAAYVASSSIKLPDIPGGATAVAELLGGSLVALGGADGRVRIIHTKYPSAANIEPIDTGGSAITSLALRADRDDDPNAPVALAVSTADGRILMFDARGGSPRPLPPVFAVLRGTGSKVHIALGQGAALIAALETASGETQIVSASGTATLAGSGPVTALTPAAKEQIAFATLDGQVRLADVGSYGVTIASTGDNRQARLPGRARQLNVDPLTQQLTALGDDGSIVRGEVSADRLVLALQPDRLVPVALGQAVGWQLPEHVPPPPPAQCLFKRDVPPFGAVDARQVNWPWMAAIVKQPDKSLVCGATLIAPRVAMTGGHCVKDFEPKNIRVLAGAVTIEELLRDVNMYEVEQTIFHPQFDKAAVQSKNDVALLVLRRDWKGPFAPLAAASFSPAQQLSVGAGFGIKGNGKLASTLREIALPLVEKSKCQASYPGDGTISDGEVCAGHDEGGEDLCQGDGGGPLVAFDENGCSFQFGIVSWGAGCGSPEKYGVYVLVPKYVDWIAATVAAVEKPQAPVAEPAGQEKGPKPGTVFRDCPNCPEMIVVPAGTFLMGSPKTELGRESIEGPQHRVTIARPFAAGRFAVTFDEWDFCVADGGCNRYSPSDQSWGRGRRPVINVSWNDAKTYIAWLSKKTGKTYRLLSEAEREYVTRAGTTTPYWWGNTISTDQANYDGNYTYGAGDQSVQAENKGKSKSVLTGGKGEYRQKTLPVGSFEQNPWGLFDVHGNVYDWVEDCYAETYNDAPTDGSARVVKDCSSRVLRGGSWLGNPQYLRAADRGRDQPDNRDSVIGFRLARTLDP